MKALKYIFLLFTVMAATACFEDESTVDTVRISEISIDSSKFNKEYNIDQWDTISIPLHRFVSQTEQQLELKYESEIGYRYYSDSCVFHYVGKELGTFPVRIKISNAHGSAFYEFTIHVNALYEEGVAVLSAKDDGTSMLSFKRNDQDQFRTHCLTDNNQGIDFPKYPADITQSGKQVFICFKDKPSIYAFNDKLLNIENITSLEFKPQRLMMPNIEGANTILLLSEEGKAYKFACLEGIAEPNPSLPSIYSRVTYFKGNWNVVAYNMVWDLETSELYNNYYNCAANMISSEYGLDFTGHQPIAMFGNKEGYFTLITKTEGTYVKTTLSDLWVKYDEDYNPSLDALEIQEPIPGSSSLSAESPLQSSPELECFWWAEGNLIFRSFFNNTTFTGQAWKELPAKFHITAFCLSPDENLLYVGGWQDNGQEMNGSVYALNSTTGEILYTYAGMAYKPIKIINKAKS